MVSMIKIHGAGVAAVAVLLLVAMLPSHASTTMDEPAVYKHAAPAPSPTSPAKAQPVIMVQGVIFCKTCKLPGYNRDIDASPLPNATAKLVCYGGGGKSGGAYRVLNMTSTPTDKTGYFLFMVYDVAMFSRESCRVYLRTSPTAHCDAPSLPADASLGIILEQSEKKKNVYSSKSVLMYAPRKGRKCPRHY
ncbi:non-classical arabinogalactan protein 30-like [Lolium rigidum]|uniref:non-classical arabinogalactan protein 30-like n=1 Tax=Lolium rigidum TaxID=89674 RepID=UPI001F5CAA52|nr:non-classical arabinogalactan protein 30-like [Lolium rigidum]